jgi:PKD repeat protein
MAIPVKAGANRYIYFDATGSYDFDGYITQYNWNFGDGSTGSGLCVSHVYSIAGEVTVSLTVVDDQGKSSQIFTKVIIVIGSEGYPLAEFDTFPEEVYSGQIIHFNASDSFDTDGFITSYEWDLGDGTKITTGNTTISHVYPFPGEYTVVLITQDNSGNRTTRSKIITILNKAPVARFTISKFNPLINEEVIFDASSSYDQDGRIVEYLWNFGDGTTAQGVRVTHAFSRTASWPVKLIVKDNSGGLSSTVEYVIVKKVRSKKGGCIMRSSCSNLTLYLIISLLLAVMTIIGSRRAKY